MPIFESSLSNKKFADNKLVEMDIPDETEYSTEEEYIPPANNRANQFDNNAIRNFQAKLENQVSLLQAEKEVKAAKNARRLGQERLNEGARRRIEILLGMIRATREVIIGENKFVFQSLKSKEMSEAYTLAAEFDGTVQSPFEIRKQLLARSLIEISGIPFDQFIGSKDINDKLYFIDEMDHALLSRLYDEYLILAEEIREKYAINSEEDAKEVLEDLKK